MNYLRSLKNELLFQLIMNQGKLLPSQPASIMMRSMLVSILIVRKVSFLKNYAYENEKNDIKTYLPSNLSDGILLEHDDISLSLFRGDIFAIFSNSLPEVKNAQGKRLGKESIINFFEKEDASRNEVIDSLLDHVNEYTGAVERRKDISVLSFVIK